MMRTRVVLVLPTNDTTMKVCLRHLSEPTTLFGEREMEKLDRLWMIMRKLDVNGQLEKILKALESEEATTSVQKMRLRMIFISGSKFVHDARINIAKYSLVRVALCIQRA